MREGSFRPCAVLAAPPADAVLIVRFITESLYGWQLYPSDPSSICAIDPLAATPTRQKGRGHD